MIPIASDIKSIIIRFLRAVLNSTLLPKHDKGDDLDCGRHRITGLSPPAGSLSAALIAISVTGQEYHYRLTGLLRNRLPQPALRSDGYRFAPCLAVFYRCRKISKQKFFASYRMPTGGLGASSEVASLFKVRQLTYSKSSDI